MHCSSAVIFCGECTDRELFLRSFYCLLSRSANLLNIERVLLIAERYIISVEELHSAARSILPHGASFQGLPLTFNVVCDAHKKEFPIQVLNIVYWEKCADICFCIQRHVFVPPSPLDGARGTF